MECPKCHFDHAQQFNECMKCGVVFAKFLEFQEAVDSVRVVEAPEISPADDMVAEHRTHTEMLCRIFALPGALLFGWLVNQGLPTLAAFLEMWLHESGHAITGWLCGYNSLPTAWFTITGSRGRWISVIMGLGLIAYGYAAFRWGRWFWVVVSTLVLALMIAGNLQSDAHSSMLISFWGEGGAYILATILMMTFYARPDSPMARNQIRWALLIIGAIAFWNVYSRWAGGFQNIANILEDTDERGPSDQRTLMLVYGWSIFDIIHRYWDVGRLCLVSLATAYAAGLLQRRQIKESFLIRNRLE
ncbi:MAG: hypothetical protein ACRD3E_08600 [Terriglobales bacterium]